MQYAAFDGTARGLFVITVTDTAKSRPVEVPLKSMPVVSRRTVSSGVDWRTVV